MRGYLTRREARDHLVIPMIRDYMDVDPLDYNTSAITPLVCQTTIIDGKLVWFCAKDEQEFARIVRRHKLRRKHRAMVPTR